MRPGSTRSTTRRRRRHPAAALALVGLALVGAAFAADRLRPATNATVDTPAQLERVLPEPQPRPTPMASQPAPKVARPKPKPRVWPQQPRPVRLGIPAIGVNAPIVRLGLNADKTAQTPENVTDTGWFAPGPEPGEKGAALIMGHVDSYKGPGVFYHLRALQRGDRITVTLADQRTLRFVVTGSKQAPKDRFPTELVFAKTDWPTLRLVTCGGVFDQSTRHYLDNYIVFARLVGRP